MKTVTVRIGVEQEAQLQAIADQMPGASVSGLVQEAVELWLNVEGTVYLEAFKSARDQIKAKRQAVA